MDKDVFSPDPELTHSTLLLINNLSGLDGKSVLDMGTGTGALAIFAAKKGAKHVTAADNNAAAIENAKANVSKYNLEGKISVVESDLFENVSDKFDVILANLPIWDSVWCERGKSVDALYGRFFSEVKSHLSCDGRILFSYASFGNMEMIENRISLSGLEYKTIKEKRFGVEWYVVEVQIPDGN